MEKMYAILQREINLATGDVFVTICKSGTQNMLIKDVSYCKMRSVFNPELTYYLAFAEYADLAKGLLEKKKVEPNPIYEKI